MKLLTYLMTSNEEDIIREILEDRVKNFDVVAIIENHSFDKHRVYAESLQIDTLKK